MKNQVIRLIAIVIIGMWVYIDLYENDQLGLMKIFAHAGLLAATFVVGIPIIFIKNKISMGEKIQLFILSMVIAMIIPFSGVGNLKYTIEDSKIKKEIEKVEYQYNVELQEDSVYIPFDNHLLVANKDETLSIFNSTGKVINRIKTTELANAVVPYLPLTDKEKETTYYDGMDANNYDILKEERRHSITLSFRFVTTEFPKNFKPEPDMPSDATDIKFHYMITYMPVLDVNGELVINSETIKEIDNQPVPVSFTSVSEGLEVIVAPSRAMLVNEIN